MAWGKLTTIALLALLSACGGKPTTMTDCADKLLWGPLMIVSAVACTYDVSHQPPPAAAPVRAVPASADLP